MEKAPETIDRQTFFKQVGISFSMILLSRCLAGCNEAEAVTPGGPVDFTLDLNENRNANLRSKGGYVYQSGVIVARTQNDTFLAVSASCTHEGTQLVYQAGNNRFYCPNHQSNFDAGGRVLNGPATRPLQTYNTSVDLAAGRIRVFS